MLPSVPFSARLEQRSRQIRILQAVCNNDIALVRALLRSCREWEDSLNLSPVKDDLQDDCCLKLNGWCSPARQLALIEAIKLGLMDMVILLLDAGTLVYSGRDCNSYGTVAAKYGQTDILQLLLERDVFHPSERDGDLVQHAFRQGNLPMIRVLMEYRRLNPESALEIAAKGGHENLVKALPVPTTIQAHDCAVAAGVEGHLDLMKCFIAITPSMKDSIARIVFMNAATVPVLEYCMTLCDSASVTKELRNTALMNAIRQDRVDVAEIHMRHGAIPKRSAVVRNFELTKTEESFLFSWN
ncbi:hypothetical protein DFS34DRAFT_641071 [Phlyctochytrium arcticum]|nr:hypothetical protein DFS34DRAFT_641071 [Phlyctochytrium arcticum]